jgi:hypothetical protein
VLYAPAWLKTDSPINSPALQPEFFCLRPRNLANLEILIGAKIALALLLRVIFSKITRAGFINC